MKKLYCVIAIALGILLVVSGLIIAVVILAMDDDSNEKLYEWDIENWDYNGAPPTPRF